MIATGAYIGAVTLTRLTRLNPGAIDVRFESHHVDCLHHLYAGRDKVGETTAVGDRQLLALLEESDWPVPLILVAVLPENSDQDFGELFPPRPFNRPQFGFTASGGSWDDAQTIEALTGEFPGDPIDATNILGRAVFQWQGAYSIQLPPMPGSGFWAGRIQGRDGTPPVGNVGDTADTTFRVTSHPPDLVGNPRFNVSVAAGVASIVCEVP
jgi:hypothetical protein